MATKRKNSATGKKNSSVKRKVIQSGVDAAFEGAFGHINPEGANISREQVEVRADRNDDDIDFNLARAAVEDNDDDEAILEDDRLVGDVDNVDHNVGFGNADYFDVNEILELSANIVSSSDIIQDLKDNCIAKKSKNTYTSTIVLFILYIYKFDRNLLNKSWIQTINSFSYKIKDDVRKLKIDKKTIKKLLLQGDMKCPPLDWENYCPKHFMKYLLSLETKDGKRFGMSSYNGRRSALFHLFRSYGESQNEKFTRELAVLFGGLKRKIILEKQNGDGRIQTGKTPMSFGLYERLNTYLLKENTTEAIFCRTFLCITWNLICRSMNTCSIHMHHIAWQDDALQIYFAHMKNDQTGSRKRDPRHLYANPVNPIVCPLLALSTYLSVFSITGAKYSKLFPGENQYKRFTSYLEKILEKYKMEIERDFGVDIKHIGSHSIRKGAATYVSSGATCSPPQVATNIRAGWTMGVVQDTYLRYKAAGDQYIGRVVSGLPICSAKFSVLPPQFNCSVTEVDDITSTCFPNIPGCMKCACRYFAASFLYHYDFLQQFSTPSHPINFVSCLTSPKFVSMKSLVVVKYAYEEEANVSVSLYKAVEESAIEVELLTDTNCAAPTNPSSSDAMMIDVVLIRKATGIPPHVLLLGNMQTVIASQQVFLTQMRSAINQEFEKRHMASESFQAKNQLEKTLTAFEGRLLAVLNVPDKNDKLHIPSSDIPGGGIWFQWGGRFNRVPKDWEFPNKVSLRNIWQRWFLCDEQNKICPLRRLQTKDVRNTKNGRRNLSGLSMVMKYMIFKAKEKGVYYDDPNEEQVMEMFHKISGCVFALNKNARCETFSWHSFTMSISKERKRLKALQ